MKKNCRFGIQHSFKTIRCLGYISANYLTDVFTQRYCHIEFQFKISVEMLPKQKGPTENY